MSGPNTTESFGVGQSGYTAGRREDDPSLENQIQVRNLSFDNPDEEAGGLGLDERWVGRGGRRWGPPDRKP